MATIAVDAMGGDFAPDEVVAGAVAAAQQYGCQVLLVGDEARIKPLLPPQTTDKISVVHAPDVIEMGEHPATAVRKKKESSLVVAARLVRKGEASALVSAGNTGAAMAASLLYIGRIKGIDRPGIGSPMPTKDGACLVIDAGANASCRPAHLLQFALMGSVYVEKIWNRSNPRVGLLNIGSEETKGSELTTTAYQLLKEADINFVGNVEGRDVNAGVCDVVVCDGFVGNVILKFAEGIGQFLFDLIKEEIYASPVTKLGGMLARPALKKVKARVDYTEYGGAPLLGTKGMTIISHGSSDRRAIKNAVRVAKESIDRQVTATIAAHIRQEGSGE